MENLKSYLIKENKGKTHFFDLEIEHRTIIEDGLTCQGPTVLVTVEGIEQEGTPKKTETEIDYDESEERYNSILNQKLGEGFLSKKVDLNTDEDWDIIMNQIYESSKIELEKLAKEGEKYERICFGVHPYYLPMAILDEKGIVIAEIKSNNLTIEYGSSPRSIDYPTFDKLFYKYIPKALNKLNDEKCFDGIIKENTLPVSFQTTDCDPELIVVAGDTSKEANIFEKEKLDFDLSMLGKGQAKEAWWFVKNEFNLEEIFFEERLDLNTIWDISDKATFEKTEIKGKIRSANTLSDWHQCDLDEAISYKFKTLLEAIGVKNIDFYPMNVTQVAFNQTSNDYYYLAVVHGSNNYIIQTSDEFDHANFIDYDCFLDESELKARKPLLDKLDLKVFRSEIQKNAGWIVDNEVKLAIETNGITGLEIYEIPFWDIDEIATLEAMHNEGDFAATWRLGVLYLEGKLVEQDIDKAVDLFLTVQGSEDWDAKSELEDYLDGYQNEKYAWYYVYNAKLNEQNGNDEVAVKMWSKAEEKGYKPAKEKLKKILQKEGNQALKAFDYMREALVAKGKEDYEKALELVEKGLEVDLDFLLLQNEKQQLLGLLGANKEQAEPIESLDKKFTKANIETKFKQATVLSKKKWKEIYPNFKFKKDIPTNIDDQCICVYSVNDLDNRGEYATIYDNQGDLAAQLFTMNRKNQADYFNDNTYLVGHGNLKHTVIASNFGLDFIAFNGKYVVDITKTASQYGLILFNGSQKPIVFEGILNYQEIVKKFVEGYYDSLDKILEDQEKYLIEPAPKSKDQLTKKAFKQYDLSDDKFWKKATPEILQEVVESGKKLEEYFGHAISFKASEETVQAMLDLGIDPDYNINPTMNQTPLMVATVHENIGAMKALIKAGAKLDVVDNYGNDLLRYTVSHGNKEVIKILNDAGVQ